MVRVHVPEPELPFTADSLPQFEILESHFAVVQQDYSDERDAKRPEAGHYVSGLILGRQAQLEPARPSGGYGQNRKRDVAQLREDFLLEVSEAMGMSKQQRAGDGNEDRKDKPGVAGGGAARLHAPFKDRQRDDEQHKKAMHKDLGIRQTRPETDGPKRPGLRIAAEK